MKQLVFFLLISISAFSQKNLKQLLKTHNNQSVPYISVDDLRKEQHLVLLDSREPKEYKVSHIKNAICVGYDHFNIDTAIKHLPQDKNSKIVVYCSLGIRSEDVAEKLLRAGYTNVFNLYGGIFTWKNKGYSVVNHKEELTHKVHTFNKEWSKWLLKGEKIYD